MFGDTVFVENDRYAGLREISNARIDGLRHWNLFLPSSTLMRRQGIIEAGYFDAELGFEEDYDMWLRIAKRFSLDAFLPQSQVFCYYSFTAERRKAAIERRNYMIHSERVRDYLSRKYGVQCALQEWLPQAGGSRMNPQNLAKPLA